MRKMIEVVQGAALKVAGKPAFVKVNPEAVVRNPATYQSWNTMLALTWLVQALCAVILFLVNPTTAAHGYWIFGSAAIGGTAAARLTVEILVAQRAVDAVIADRVIAKSGKRAENWVEYRREALMRMTAANTIAQVLIPAFAYVSYCLHTAPEDVALAWLVPTTTAMIVFWPLVSGVRYFQVRKAERKALIGR
jgi:hypothetical protein